jgi:hypothetical protein
LLSGIKISPEERKVKIPSLGAVGNWLVRTGAIGINRAEILNLALVDGNVRRLHPYEAGRDEGGVGSKDGVGCEKYELIIGVDGVI